MKARGFYLAAVLLLLFSTPVHASYTYTFVGENLGTNGIDIIWSFTVPEIVSLPFTLSATSLDTQSTSNVNPIVSIQLFIEAFPYIGDRYVAQTWFDAGMGNGVGIGFIGPIDHVGTYINADAGGSLTIAATPVPIPAAVWLLGSGLIGLIGARRKFKHNQNQ